MSPAQNEGGVIRSVNQQKRTENRYDQPSCVSHFPSRFSFNRSPAPTRNNFPSASFPNGALMRKRGTPPESHSSMVNAGVMRGVRPCVSRSQENDSFEC